MALALTACGGGGGDSGADASNPPPGAAPPPVAESITRYFPLRANARWYYEGITSDDTLIMHLTGARIQGTGSYDPYELVTLDPSDDGSTPTLRGEYYDFEADGLYEVALPWGDNMLRRAIGSIRILPFPVVSGERWVAVDRRVVDLLDADEDGLPDVLHVRIEGQVLGIADETFAGVTLSRVVHVRRDEVRVTTLAAGGAPREERRTVEEWFAPDVGLVRIRVSDAAGGVTADYRLKAWRVGTQSSESTPPRIVSISPAEGSINGNVHVIVEFSEAMDVPSWPVWLLNDFLLAPFHGGNSGFRAQWLDAKRFEIRVDTFSRESGTYSVHIPATLLDVAGNALAEAGTRTFSVDSEAPKLLSTEPASGTRDLPLQPVLRFLFDEDIVPTSPVVRLRVPLLGDNAIPVRLAVSGREIEVQPLAPLAEGTMHSLHIEGAADRFGRAAGRVEFSFRTDPGRFAAPTRILGSDSEQTRSVASLDLGGDGRRDLAALSISFGFESTDSRLDLYRALAEGGLTAGPVLQIRLPDLYAHDVFATDLDGDGLDDLVATGCHLGDCRVLGLLQRDGGFLAPARLAALPSTRTTVRPWPVAGMARPAFVLLDPNSRATPALLLADAAGAYTAQAEIAGAVAGAGEALAGDVDGDGDLDLVLLAPMRHGGGWSVHQMSASGSPVPVQTSNPPDGQGLSAAGLGDVDADGRADLLVLLRSTLDVSVATLWMARGQADGSLGALERLSGEDSPLRLGNDVTLAVGDIDGDGRADIVAGAGGGFTWLRQLSGGRWGVPRSYEGQGPWVWEVPRMHLADFTGDGRIDVQIGRWLSRQRPPTEFVELGGGD